jgi:hypothetical protein
MLRDYSQPFNSPLHCENARPVDVDAVDLVDIDKRDRGNDPEGAGFAYEVMECSTLTPARGTSSLTGKLN